MSAPQTLEGCRLVVAIALASLQLGCTGTPTTSHRFELRDDHGVRIATTHGGPRYSGDLFTLEPELTLIQDPERPDSFLYDASGFVEGPDAKLYVADSGNHRIAVFDRTGNYLRSFGREGQGPGEFGGGVQIESLRQDVLEVFDLAGKRTHRFGLDGTLLETLQTPDRPQLRGLYRLSDGRRVVRFSDNDRQDELILRSAGVAVMTGDGRRVLAEVSTRLVPSMLMRATRLASGGVATVAITIPFSGQPGIVEIPARGFALTQGNTSEIDEYDYDGILVRRVRLPLDAVPVTATMRERYEQLYRQAMAETEARQPLPGAAPDLEYPDTAGVWSAIRADDQGYLWLQDAAFIGEPGRPRAWLYHVVNPEGRYLGTVQTPAGDFNIRAGRMFALVDDPQTGEPVATIFRLRPVPPEFRYPR